MRVMVVQPGPAFSVADVASGIRTALAANGCKIFDYRLHDVLIHYTHAHVRRDDGEWQKCFTHHEALTIAMQQVYGEVFKFWPDVVIFISGFYTFPRLYEILRARRMRTILWCTESPYEDSTQIVQAPYADLCILNDPTNLAAFRAVQPNTHYLPHSYDPQRHQRRPHDPSKASDFFWVGTGYPSRRAFFEAVDWTGIDIKLGGNWELLDGETSSLLPHLVAPPRECMDNDEAVSWYSSTKASVNVYRQEHGDGDVLKPASAGWAMGPREVELAALGTFFLTEARGENREVLPMVPTFDGPGDFGEQLRWWLARDVERDEVAAKARAAIADRTFEATAARMLQLLDH